MKLAVDKLSGTIEGNPEVGPSKLMAGIAFSQPMHLLDMPAQPASENKAIFKG